MIVVFQYSPVLLDILPISELSKICWGIMRHYGTDKLSSISRILEHFFIVFEANFGTFWKLLAIR